MCAGPQTCLLARSCIFELVRSSSCRHQGPSGPPACRCKPGSLQSERRDACGLGNAVEHPATLGMRCRAGPLPSACRRRHRRRLLPADPPPLLLLALRWTRLSLRVKSRTPPAPSTSGRGGCSRCGREERSTAQHAEAAAPASPLRRVLRLHPAASPTCRPPALLLHLILRRSIASQGRIASGRPRPTAACQRSTLGGRAARRRAPPTAASTLRAASGGARQLRSLPCPGPSPSPPTRLLAGRLPVQQQQQAGRRWLGSLARAAAAANSSSLPCSIHHPPQPPRARLQLPAPRTHGCRRGAPQNRLQVGCAKKKQELWVCKQCGCCIAWGRTGAPGSSLAA